MSKTMRYLPVNVYTNNSFGDCTNGGVTFTHPDNLVVPCENGFLSADDVFNGDYIVLVPGKILDCPHFKPEGVEGWLMMGGNFVYSSDSRFSRVYGNQPVQVHDRLEQ